MKFIFFHSSPLILLSFSFIACDQLPVPPEVMNVVSDQNNSGEKKQTLTLEATPDPKFVKKPKPKILPPPPKPPSLPEVPDPEISLPVEPEFSDDLLAAVKNWTKIPRSVFPARPILSSVPINLVAKASTGQIIGNSLTPAGTELQVLGMNGPTLIVANSNNHRLRGEVDIDKTDFKQLLAYRFELNKRKRANLEKRRKEAQSSHSKNEIDNQHSEPTIISDEIPDPLDFGHGRFCICKDCREKRLAKTGSLKTGFGLDP